MASVKKPVTGMKDITPAEMQIRECVMDQIREAYRGFGFPQIKTPCMEHIENLTSKQGGDSEKLIFKILKRGDKLSLETISEENNLMDNGLRYDLTLPLLCYYTNNAANLLSPLRAPQMGSVWHVSKSQKGRLRQLVQCDIDVLDDPVSLAEIELILATTAALSRIYPSNTFTVRINNREVLRGTALHCGFSEGSMDQALVTLDKMGKIDLEGMEKELLELGYQRKRVDKYLGTFRSVTRNTDGVRAFGQKLANATPFEVSRNLVHIMDTVTEVSEANFGLGFDPTLVYDMSYYTGTIFKISMEGFGDSIADGGRHDKMIGKFMGMETPAYGFSAGSERIVTILMDNGFKVSGAREKKVHLFEKGVDNITLTGMIREAMEERKKGVHALVARMNRNKKSQREQLRNEGYTEFKGSYREGLKK